MALKIAENNPTVIVAEDTDVLILLLQHTPSDAEDIIFLLNTSTRKKRRIWPIQQV